MNASNATVQHPFVGEPIGYRARVAFIFVSCVEIVSGTLGSFLLLAVLSSSRSLSVRSCHYLFIVNLALVDLISMGYWMTFFVLDLLLGYHPVVNMKHCIANGFIICTFQIVTMLSLVTISLNRYLHVCHKRVFSRYFTKRGTIGCCLAIWLVAVVIAGVPPMFGVGLYHYKALTHTCSFNSQKRATYPKTMTVILNVGSTCFIGYFNLAIFRYWKRLRMKATHRFTFSCKNKSRDKTHGEISGQASVPGQADDGHVVDGEQSDGHKVETEGTFYSGDHESSAHSTVQTSEEWKSSNADDETSEDDADDDEDDSLCEEGDESGPDGAPDDTTSKKESESWADDAGEDEETALEVAETACSEEKTGTLSKDSDFAAEDVRHKASQNETDKNNIAATIPTKEPLKSSVHSNRSKSSKKEGGSKNRKRGSHMKRLSQHRRKQQRRDRAFVRSLFVVFLLTLITFLPFGISKIVATFHGLSAEVAISVQLMYFSNCAVNWIVYGAMNRSFRKDYVKLLKQLLGGCRCRPLSGQT